MLVLGRSRIRKAHPDATAQPAPEGAIYSREQLNCSAAERYRTPRDEPLELSHELFLQWLAGRWGGFASRRVRAAGKNGRNQFLGGGPLRGGELKAHAEGYKPRMERRGSDVKVEPVYPGDFDFNRKLVIRGPV